MLIQPLLIAAACALALSACASAPRAPKTSVPPPPATIAPERPAAPGGSVYGAANTGGTYPYGTIQTANTGATQQAAADSTDEIVVMGPDGAVWVRSGAVDARYQSDVDSCYAYARGQVAHDARIESDVSAAFQSEAGGLGLAALRGRMNNFERTRRVPSLFNSCMAAKGYASR
ncbi:MAG: hypothetical protein IID48_06225 [Proteobacteria bacterium]|nr:hypothetical protein [Pseudomonadota bacterium]